ncbi:putative cytochrome p450 [Lyophyllum shimeji]|uniref:Cytochrome p450 n=1 Tax=Lyophyllum shimeji TaxID=47721 RepID=A0A9P3UQ58_LYOSH|nr:putative cytochrome p450 [Lyophyllum shimeji]
MQRIPVHKGTHIVVGMVGVQYNPRSFENQEEYRPSRRYGTRDSEAFTAFSVGPRACIGRILCDNRSGGVPDDAAAGLAYRTQVDSGRDKGGAEKQGAGDTDSEAYTGRATGAGEAHPEEERKGYPAFCCFDFKEHIRISPDNYQRVHLSPQRFSSSVR